MPPNPYFQISCSQTRLIGAAGSCSGTGSGLIRSNISGNVAMSVCSVDVNSFRSGKFECDQNILARRGYMQTPNDWRDVEVTQYVKVKGTTGGNVNTGSPHLSIWVRGGIHSHSEICGGCQGTAIKAAFYQSGRVKLEKELEHTSGFSLSENDPQVLAAQQPLQGAGWIGLKLVVYNLTNGNVKIEAYNDRTTPNATAPGNNWRKLIEFTDTGSNWCAKNAVCGSSNRCQKISWGGPLVTFRSDNMIWDQRWVTVREINYKL